MIIFSFFLWSNLDFGTSYKSNKDMSKKIRKTAYINNSCHICLHLKNAMKKILEQKFLRLSKV